MGTITSERMRRALPDPERPGHYVAPLTPQEMVEERIEAYGTNAKTRIHFLSDLKPVETILTVTDCAHMLTNEPRTLLFIPKRLGHGSVVPAFVRAGAIAYVEAA